MNAPSNKDALEFIGCKFKMATLLSLTSLTEIKLTYGR